MKTQFLILTLALLIASCAKDAPEPEFNPNVATEQSELNEKLDFVYASPLKFVSKTTIVYRLKKTGQVKLSICHPDEGEIMVLEEGWMEKGLHQYEFNGDFLAPGKYILRLKFQDEMVTSSIYRLVKEEGDVDL